MLAPLVLSVMASLKSTVEAAAIPPTYFTHELSLDSYAKLWGYQDGLPTYLFNSAVTAVLAIAFSLALTIPAGYALARFPVPGKEYFFIFLLLALIIPYQALITPIFFMFAELRLTNTLVGLAIIHTAVQIPFSVYVMRNSFEAVPKELEEAAVIRRLQQLAGSRPDLPSSDQAGDCHRRAVRFHHVLERVPRGPRHHEPRRHVHAAAGARRRAPGDEHRRHDWGLLQAGVTVRRSPACCSTCCCRSITSPVFSAAASANGAHLCAKAL